MKLKETFALRQVADTWVVLSLWSETANFSGMLSLNNSGALLWRELEKGGDRNALAEALCAEYIVTKEEALADVDEFLEKLEAFGCLEM